MSNGFIYVVDAHFIDKIEKKNILDPSACGSLQGTRALVTLTQAGY
jgi:hypothetical protein